MEDDQQPLGEEEEEVQADTVQHYICIYIYIYIYILRKRGHHVVELMVALLL